MIDDRFSEMQKIFEEKKDKMIEILHKYEDQNINNGFEGRIEMNESAKQSLN